MTEEEQWARLGFEERQARFESAPQNARIWTEAWVAHSAFCPACGAVRLRKLPNNLPAADFDCLSCREEFELKGTKKEFGSKIVDGAYDSMCERVDADNNPSLMLMTYDADALKVRSLLVVPKYFFVRELIERRKPLAPTARRAGWVGCNILLKEVPQSGRVYLVRDGQLVSKRSVLEAWRRTVFLQEEKVGARGWLIEVMKCVEKIGRPEFRLDDVYKFEEHLSSVYPGNKNVRPKIRQQLQVLRDRGYLRFLGGGRYAIGTD